MQRQGEERNAVRLLDDLAEIHDRNVVADILHHAEIVGDEQVGEAEPLLQLAEQVQDLRLDRDIEGGDGLVADDQLRLRRQRPRDADPLALAAGELVREERRLFGPEADAVEKLGDAEVALRRGRRLP